MRLLVGIILLAAANIASAATNYVYAGATGAATGADWTDAFTTLPAALTRGNTYYIADGGYGAYTFDDAESGEDVITIKKATVSDHGTETGWDNAYGDGQAEFAHDGTTSFGNHCWMVNEGYYTFDGATGTGNNPGSFGFKLLSRGTAGGDESRVFIGTGSEVIPVLRFEHIEFETFIADDIGKFAIDQHPTVTWPDSYVGNCYMNGAQAAVVLTSTDNVIVERCFITNHFSSEGNHGNVINMKAIAVDDPCTNIVFRFNTFADHTGTGCISANDAGITAVSADYIYIYGNVFGGQQTGPSGGKGYIGATTAGGLNNCFVFFNTFTRPSTNNDSWLGDVGQGGTGCVATNNLLYSMSATVSAGWASDYNYFVDTSNTPSEGNSETGAGNPFVNSSGGNYRLLAVTPAGLTLGSPYNVDPDGVTRSRPDRGAYEYQAPRIWTITTLNAAQVNAGGSQ